MKVKLYIVTYNQENELNNWCLKSLFDSTFPFDNNVFIINNHSNFVLYDEYKNKVQVLHNVLRSDDNNGHLGQNWNQAITLGFKSLVDPDCDIVITVQVDTIFIYNWFTNVENLLTKYQYICFGAGDQVQIFTPEHIRKVGLYDENISNIAFHEHDYFIRCVLYNQEFSSISDYHHGRLVNPQNINFLSFTETGDRRKVDYYSDIRKFHSLGFNLLEKKWSYIPMNKDWTNLEIFNKINLISPQYMRYPYFESEMYSLEKKGYVLHKKIKNIVIFVALESEFSNDNLPENVKVHYTGVGKVNAAIKATQVLLSCDPSKTIVFNYGSAGSQDLSKNNLYKCTKFIQYDMDARPLCELYETPYDDSKYPEISSIINFGDEGYLCASADQFQESPTSQIVDMEAYSIAKVCKIFGFDFTSYKFVSDNGDADDWKQNHMNGIDLFMKVLNEH
jgi:adenosylhomocysteine nucleosidase